MPLSRAFGHLFRRLFRTPLFTVVAVVTLGVGIGANAALFSVVYGVVLKPLPFHEPERLAGVWHVAPGVGSSSLPLGPAFYFTYRDESRVFEQLGLWDDRAASVTGAGEPERLDALAVTDGTLPALGVMPAVGRLFSREDDSPGDPRNGHPRLCLLAAEVRRRPRHRRPPADDRRQTARGDRRPAAVVQVPARPGPRSSCRCGSIAPRRMSATSPTRGSPGSSRASPLQQANADVARMIPLVLERFPLPPGFTREMVAEARLGPDVHPLSFDVVGDVGGLLWLLLGGVGIVLLIACANVANLFLVRAEGRQRELAIRSALGAGPGRIARELLGESVALGLAGGVLGLALAWGAVRLLRAIAPEGLPRLDEISIDPIVLVFTLAVSVVAGLVFGLIPVAKFAVPRLAALKDGGRSASDSRERHRVRNVLVVAEIALALVLLIGSGLMARTFVALRNVNPGYSNPDEVLTFRVSVPEAMVPDDEQAARLHEQVVQRLREVPGVVSVGLSSSVTMDGNDSHDPVLFEDFPLPPGQMPKMHRHKWIGPDYFAAMGNRVLAGRDLTWADIYAARRWPSSRRTWRASTTSPRPPPSDTASGQAPGTRGARSSASSATSATTASGCRRRPSSTGRSSSRTSGRRRASSGGRRATWCGRAGWPRRGSSRRSSRRCGRQTPTSRSRTSARLNQLRARSMAQTSFMLVILAIAAAVALMLGVVGIYGVIAYIAAQRTREVGIRMALGAQRGDVSRLFIRHGLVLTAVGLVAGVGLAIGLTRLMSAQLFGVSPVDGPTYAAVAAGLATIALLATYLPARRASRVDPVEALRSDA